MNDRKGDTTGMANGTDAIVQPWMEYWSKWMEQNNEWTKALMAGTPPNVDPVAIRQQWLATMSKSIDGYLRSPTFLESMRRNAEAMTAMKVTADLAKVEAARQAGIPHVEDIHGLYDRLETAHETLLQRLHAIEARLASIESKLDAKSEETAGKQA